MRLLVLVSCRSELYWTVEYMNGYSSTIAVTHNVENESMLPDVIEGEISKYVRLTKTGTTKRGEEYLFGMDFAHVQSEEIGNQSGLSAYADLSWNGYEF